MRLPLSVLLLTASVSALACSDAGDGAAGPSLGGDRAVGSVAQALSAPTFFYFRCNSTGFDPNDQTRLVASSDPGVLALTYDVSEPWIINSSESCVFTETPLLNAWGDWQRYYSNAGALSVPASGTAFETASPTPFQVTYPALGSYRVEFDLATGAFSIAAAAALEPPQIVTDLPPSIEAPVNEPTTIVVEASGDGLTYQWQTRFFNQTEWTDIAGATTSELTVTPAIHQFCQHFRVIVSNASGQVASSETFVTPVVEGSLLQDLPTAVSVRPGNALTLTIAANNAGPREWFVNGVSQGLTASNTLTFDSLSLTDDGTTVQVVVHVQVGNNVCARTIDAISRTTTIRVSRRSPN